MRNELTGQLAPLRCKSHFCPTCSAVHQMTARHALTVGALRARRQERASLFLTLTQGPKASLDLPAFRERWKATLKRLRRMWGVSEYGLVVEFQERGALHPHVIAWAPVEVADDLADRRTRASYRRRMHELRPMAESVGWGQMVDAVAIELANAEEVGRYAAKKLAGYATKEAAQAFARKGAKYVRPVRLSRGFYPGGLTAAREAVTGKQEGAQPGRWVRAKGIHDAP